MVAFSTKHTLARRPPPLPYDLPRPLRQREAPVTGHKCAAKDIDHLDQKDEETIPRLDDVEQDGLNVVLDENTRDGAFADVLLLFGHGVLVGEDGFGPRCAREADTVGCGDNGEEVLEFVEVAGRHANGAVEGVDEGGEEGAEG